jgi:hypothetical protein
VGQLRRIQGAAAPQHASAAYLYRLFARVLLQGAGASAIGVLPCPRSRSRAASPSRFRGATACAQMRPPTASVSAAFCSLRTIERRAAGEVSGQSALLNRLLTLSPTCELTSRADTSAILCTLHSRTRTDEGSASTHSNSAFVRRLLPIDSQLPFPHSIPTPLLSPSLHPSSPLRPAPVVDPLVPLILPLLSVSPLQRTSTIFFQACTPIEHPSDSATLQSR